MDDLENKSDEELWEIVKRGVNLLPHVPQSESNRAKRILDYRNSRAIIPPMKKLEEKRRLVKELESYFKKLDVHRLYGFPDQEDSKNWLAEVASILKNLDETDYQAFQNHRQHLHSVMDRETRKHAALQIEAFTREKVATWKRYDFKLNDNPTASNDDTGGLLFWGYIHPKIAAVSRSRFQAKHYADSVEAAFKEIEENICSKVKAIKGRELSGADLMNTAFSPKDPVIILDSLNTQSGNDIQIGYMQIFAGAMTGIRNPKAHRNIKIPEENAIHLLFLASLLMFNLEKGHFNTK